MTRRRVGRAAVGLAALLVSLGARETAASQHADRTLDRALMRLVSMPGGPPGMGREVSCPPRSSAALA